MAETISNFFKNINLLKWKDGPKEKALIICHLLSIVFSSIIIILSRIISFDGEISRSISNELIDNFETGFFMNFSNSTSGSLVKFGEWQGIVKGCGLIKNGKKESKYLEEGEKCKDGEESIDGISPQDLLIYKNFSFSASTKGKYFDLLKDGSIIKEGKVCPKNKKVCGYIDTLKNMLCVNNNTECPISYIKIQDSKPIGIENIITITGKKTNFYFSNNPYPNSNEIPYILNSFKIADSTICALPNLYYSSISLSDLDGFKKKYSTNCVLKDYSQRVTVDKIRYKEIDAIDNYDLYEENKIIEKIQKNSKLLEYGYDIEKLKNHRLFLYIRTHFGFDYDCLLNMGFEIDWLVYMYGQADNMIMFGNFVLSNIAIIGFSILNFFSFFHSSLEFIIKYSVNILSSGCLILYCNVAKGYDDYYEKKMECSDVITNNNYNIMIYKIKRSGEIIIYIFIIYILLFIDNIIGVIIQLWIEKQKNNSIEQKKINYKKQGSQILEEINNKEEGDDQNKILIPEDEKSLNSINIDNKSAK